MSNEKYVNDYMADPLKVIQPKEPKNIKPRAKRPKRQKQSKSEIAQQYSATVKDDSDNVAIIIVVVFIFVSSVGIGYYVYFKKKDAREHVQVGPDPEKASRPDFF